MQSTHRTPPALAVARYLLLDRVTFLVLPWAWAAFGFALDVVILHLVPASQSHERWVGGLAAVFVVVFSLGVQTVARALPFGLALGVSRRAYFRGATALAVALAVGFGSVVAAGQVAERATDGWGIRMAYFRVPDVLDGSWWQTWLTATAAFVLVFVYGMWHGLAYSRAGLAGTLTFTAAQGVVLVLVAAITTWAHGWRHLGHFLASTATASVPVILAGLAVVLLAGVLATVRGLAV